MNVRARLSIGLTALALEVAAAGCGLSSACHEDIRAQRLDERVSLVVGDETIDAELADDDVELGRGWMHRRCSREGILLVSPDGGPLPIWGCGLVAPIDLYFIRDGEVQLVVHELEPCDSACGRCPAEGDGLDVDAVLETPTGDLTAQVGTAVSGWP